MANISAISQNGDILPYLGTQFSRALGHGTNKKAFSSIEYDHYCSNPQVAHQKQSRRGSTTAASVMQASAYGISPSAAIAAEHSDDNPLPALTCFYVRGKVAKNAYHRAIYLPEQTMRALVDGIADKFEVEVENVGWITYSNSRNMQVVVDEDVLSTLTSGQDMVVEFAPHQSSQKAEFPIDRGTDLPITGQILPPVPIPDEIINFESFFDSMQIGSLGIYSEQISPSINAQAEVFDFSNSLSLHSPGTDFTSSLPDTPAYWRKDIDPVQLTPPDDIHMTEAILKSKFKLSVSPTSNLGCGRIKPKPLKKRKNRKQRGQSIIEAGPNQRLQSLEKNRVAAARCRVKRKEQEAEKQEELRAHIFKNNMLVQTILGLEEEVALLRGCLDRHIDCGSDGGRPQLCMTLDAAETM